MRLTTYTDYALRVLMFVAVREEALTTISEISKAYGISRNHLMKVVHELGVAGYLETIRGKNGGLRLARPADKINIGRIVRECEQNTVLVECFQEGGGDCRIEGVCMLRKVLRDGLNAFFKELERYTLKDLVKPKRELERVLAFPAPPAKSGPRRRAAG
jgi:Rrf2 family nitric oxide-sensitive transcriptional repressor